MVPTAPRERTWHIGGTRVAGLEWPAAGPTVLAVHGFPDSPWSWEPVAGLLGAQGYRVVAPYLPGYGASEPLPGATLVAVAEHLLDCAASPSAEPIFWLGHDWGAMFGYLALERWPHRVRDAVLLSVPPPSQLAARWCLSPPQALASSYMLAFQCPWLPERLLSRSGLAAIRAIWGRWSPGWQPPEAALSRAAEALHTQEQWEASLAYYRLLLPGRRGWLEDATAAWSAVFLPALTLHGDRDRCILAASFAAMPAAQRQCVPGAGHFLPLEAPAAVADAALSRFR